MVTIDTHPKPMTALAGRLTLLHKLLAQPVDASSLATFRLLFGALMVWEVIRYFEYDFIGRYYIQPTFYFTYEFFPFVAPLPGAWMYALFAAMGLFALGIALGFYYKWAAAFFFLTYTYVFLLDKTPYNNHYYLISLISFLLIFVDSHRWLSVDNTLQRQTRASLIPFWQLFILRAQIFIVYFYGGMAKLNRDWLVGEPMRMWLAERADYPLFGSLFTTEWAVYFFSYGGLLFDLLISFLLLWKPTRFPAFLAVLFFHLTNQWLFSIGIFPFLGIAATILFVEPGWPRRMCRHLVRLIPSWQPQPISNSTHSIVLNTWTFGFILLYLALQLLIPLRHWLYPGNVNWTEEGHRFSWHMKLRDKDARIDLNVIDPNTGEIWRVDLTADLTPWQIEKMASRPDMIWQYAHHLSEKLRQAGIKPIIKAKVWTSLNGRAYQPLIDPNINLAEVRPGLLAPAEGILPLQEEISADITPVLCWLTITAVLLADLSLAWTIYMTLATYRIASNHFLSPTSNPTNRGYTLVAVPQAGVLSILSLVLITLAPYVAILSSIAAWVALEQSVYLGIALVAALLAGARGFYIAPPLFTSPAQRASPIFWLAPWLSVATGLFLVMIIIIATSAV